VGDRVGDGTHPDLAEAVAIPAPDGRDSRVDGDSISRDAHLLLGDDLADEGDELEGARPDREASGRDRGRVQQIADEPSHLRQPSLDSANRRLFGAGLDGPAQLDGRAGR
jgi:hypothetical protein